MIGDQATPVRRAGSHPWRRIFWRCAHECRLTGAGSAVYPSARFASNLDEMGTPGARSVNSDGLSRVIQLHWASTGLWGCRWASVGTARSSNRSGTCVKRRVPLRMPQLILKRPVAVDRAETGFNQYLGHIMLSAVVKGEFRIRPSGSDRDLSAAAVRQADRLAAEQLEPLRLTTSGY